MKIANLLLKNNWVPEQMIRNKIVSTISERLQQEEGRQAHYKDEFISKMKQSPIAISTDIANQQHYEVPTAFFQLVLGKHLKYSSGLWESPILKEKVEAQDFLAGLDESEATMLALTLDRSQIQDGDRILELGCGWGSLTFYLARQCPQAKITAITNSRVQKASIDEKAQQLGIGNIEVVCCDMNHLDLPGKYDRVISIEMFEHMRNYQKLLEKISSLMNPQATLFVHIFCHKEFLYPFSTENDDSWMAEFFFKDGIMPSFDIFDHFPVLQVIDSWKVNGKNYSYTSEAWYQNTVNKKNEIIDLYTPLIGKGPAKLQWAYWKIFFLSCAHLFGWDNGEEWMVGHYLLKK